ncbi:dihydrofolate reductase [Corynebacterium bovis]|uniref:dihydrofolate reductase n=1 Tax=Corynebacterium bovis TaxID=36808 RepID=UPI00254F75BF|nr:dihydrofolate reductase [Corynebacterium bovis]MDK8511124.1 dihydrofolate reductase [Corynebacterium bovis]
MTGTHGAPRDDAARTGDDAAHPPLDLATVRADLPDDVEIAMIWAQTTAGVIGDGADMPWHLPEDLRHFTDSTRGAPVVMGRISWEALADGYRPLPGRVNIVVSRDGSYDAPGGTVVTSVPASVSAAAEALRDGSATGRTVWILGGGQIYRQCLPVSDRVVVTEIGCGSPDRFTVTAPSMDDAVRTGEWEVSSGPWLTSENGTALTGETHLRYRIREYTRTSRRRPLHP